MQGTLQVLDANDKEVTLQDPKTKVKTVVPKIQQAGNDTNDPGKLIMSNKPTNRKRLTKKLNPVIR